MGDKYDVKYDGYSCWSLIFFVVASYLIVCNISDDAKTRVIKPMYRVECVVPLKTFCSRPRGELHDILYRRRDGKRNALLETLQRLVPLVLERPYDKSDPRLPPILQRELSKAFLTKQSELYKRSEDPDTLAERIAQAYIDGDLVDCCEDRTPREIPVSYEGGQSFNVFGLASHQSCHRHVCPIRYKLTPQEGDACKAVEHVLSETVANTALADPAHRYAKGPSGQGHVSKFHRDELKDLLLDKHHVALINDTEFITTLEDFLISQKQPTVTVTVNRLPNPKFIQKLEKQIRDPQAAAVERSNNSPSSSTSNPGNLQYSYDSGGGEKRKGGFKLIKKTDGIDFNEEKINAWLDFDTAKAVLFPKSDVARTKSLEHIQKSLMSTFYWINSHSGSDYETNSSNRDTGPSNQEDEVTDILSPVVRVSTERYQALRRLQHVDLSMVSFLIDVPKHVKDSIMEAYNCAVVSTLFLVKAMPDQAIFVSTILNMTSGVSIDLEPRAMPKRHLNLPDADVLFHLQKLTQNTKGFDKKFDSDESVEASNRSYESIYNELIRNKEQKRARKKPSGPDREGKEEIERKMSFYISNEEMQQQVAEQIDAEKQRIKEKWVNQRDTLDTARKSLMGGSGHADQKPISPILQSALGYSLGLLSETTSEVRVPLNNSNVTLYTLKAIPEPIILKREKMAAELSDAHMKFTTSAIDSIGEVGTIASSLRETITTGTTGETADSLTDTAGNAQATRETTTSGDAASCAISFHVEGNRPDGSMSCSNTAGEAMSIAGKHNGTISMTIKRDGTASIEKIITLDGKRYSEECEEYDELQPLTPEFRVDQHTGPVPGGLEGKLSGEIVGTALDERTVESPMVDLSGEPATIVPRAGTASIVVESSDEVSNGIPNRGASNSDVGSASGSGEIPPSSKTPSTSSVSEITSDNPNSVLAVHETQEPLRYKRLRRCRKRTLKEVDTTSEAPTFNETEARAQMSTSNYNRTEEDIEFGRFFLHLTTHTSTTTEVLVLHHDDLQASKMRCEDIANPLFLDKRAHTLTEYEEAFSLQIIESMYMGCENMITNKEVLETYGASDAERLRYRYDRFRFFDKQSRFFSLRVESLFRRELKWTEIDIAGVGLYTKSAQITVPIEKMEYLNLPTVQENFLTSQALSIGNKEATKDGKKESWISESSHTDDETRVPMNRWTKALANPPLALSSSIMESSIVTARELRSAIVREALFSVYSDSNLGNMNFESESTDTLMQFFLEGVYSSSRKLESPNSIMQFLGLEMSSLVEEAEKRNKMESKKLFLSLGDSELVDEIPSTVVTSLQHRKVADTKESTKELTRIKASKVTGTTTTAGLRAWINRQRDPYYTPADLLEEGANNLMDVFYRLAKKDPTYLERYTAFLETMISTNNQMLASHSAIESGQALAPTYTLKRPIIRNPVSYFYSLFLDKMLKAERKLVNKRAIEVSSKVLGEARYLAQNTEKQWRKKSRLEEPESPSFTGMKEFIRDLKSSNVGQIQYFNQAGYGFIIEPLSKYKSDQQLQTDLTTPQGLPARDDVEKKLFSKYDAANTWIYPGTLNSPDGDIDAQKSVQITLAGRASAVNKNRRADKNLVKMTAQRQGDVIVLERTEKVEDTRDVWEQWFEYRQQQHDPEALREMVPVSEVNYLTDSMCHDVTEKSDAENKTPAEKDALRKDSTDAERDINGKDAIGERGTDVKDALEKGSSESGFTKLTLYQRLEELEKEDEKKKAKQKCIAERRPLVELLLMEKSRKILEARENGQAASEKATILSSLLELDDTHTDLSKSRCERSADGDEHGRTSTRIIPKQPLPVPAGMKNVMKVVLNSTDFSNPIPASTGTATTTSSTSYRSGGSSSSTATGGSETHDDGTPHASTIASTGPFTGAGGDSGALCPEVLVLMVDEYAHKTPEPVEAWTPAQELKLLSSTKKEKRIPESVQDLIDLGIL